MLAAPPFGRANGRMVTLIIASWRRDIEIQEVRK
jgi:hypothetical protein